MSAKPKPAPAKPAAAKPAAASPAKPAAKAPAASPAKPAAAKPAAASPAKPAAKPAAAKPAAASPAKPAAASPAKAPAKAAAASPAKTPAKAAAASPVKSPSWEDTPIKSKGSYTSLPAGLEGEKDWEKRPVSQVITASPSKEKLKTNHGAAYNDLKKKRDALGKLKQRLDKLLKFVGMLVVREAGQEIPDAHKADRDEAVADLKKYLSANFPAGDESKYGNEIVAKASANDWTPEKFKPFAEFVNEKARGLGKVTNAMLRQLKEIAAKESA